MHFVELQFLNFYSEYEDLIKESEAGVKALTEKHGNPSSLKEALLRIQVPGIVAYEAIQAQRERQGEPTADAKALASLSYDQLVFFTAYHRTRRVYRVTDEMCLEAEGLALSDSLLVSDIQLPANGLVIEFPNDRFIGCYYDLKSGGEKDGALVLKFIEITSSGCERLIELDLNSEGTVMDQVCEVLNQSIDHTKGYLNHILKSTQQSLVDKLQSEMLSVLEILSLVMEGQVVVRQPGSPTIFDVKKAS